MLLKGSWKGATMANHILTPKMLLKLRKRTLLSQIRFTEVLTGCTGCYCLINSLHHFTDEASQREFQLSGMCQACQNQIWDEQGNLKQSLREEDSDEND